MFHNKTIAVVIPAFNEEQQIAMVLLSMPAFVDRIIVVNDFSKDNTASVVKDFIDSPHNVSPQQINSNLEKDLSGMYNRANVLLQQFNKDEIKWFTPRVIENLHPENSRIILINHLKNKGVGAAIATGYKWCKDHDIDCTAVMAGDGQMDPEELESICHPIVSENIDYAKGNRLIHRSSWLTIPRVRYFGNSVLSILTKIASGYWHVSDTQSGYTAISKRALNAIPLYKIYKRFGMPNDMLVKLNIAFCTIKEIEIKPVYAIGEKSKMKVLKVLFPMIWLLTESFIKRLWNKYLFRDFHPLFLFYNISFLLGIIAIPYGIKILKIVLNHADVNPVTLLVFVFLIISSLQALLFAMWMDIQDNERLYKN
ncbi:MAG: glycosyltransferase family 2 protein [Bacteroidota bacterium]